MVPTYTIVFVTVIIVVVSIINNIVVVVTQGRKKIFNDTLTQFVFSYMASNIW